MLGIALLQLLRLRVIRKSCYSYPLCSPAQAIAFFWWIIHTAKSSAAKDKGPPTTPQVYWFLFSLYVRLKSVKWIVEAQTVKKERKKRKRIVSTFNHFKISFLTHQGQKKLQHLIKCLVRLSSFKSHLSEVSLFLNYYCNILNIYIIYRESSIGYGCTHIFDIMWPLATKKTPAAQKAFSP